MGLRILRYCLLLLGIAAPEAGSAASPEVPGWTIAAHPNAAVPTAFKVDATRTVGVNRVVYERTVEDGNGLSVVHNEDCSGEAVAGYGASAAERVKVITKEASELIDSVEAGCLLTNGAMKGLSVGLEQAIQAADALFESSVPKLAMAPRSVIREGWTLDEEPGPPSSSLPDNYLLKMRKVNGPYLLTYMVELPLTADRVSAAEGLFEGKFKACDFKVIDASEFLVASNRTRALRPVLEVEFARAATGCGATQQVIGDALAGFDAAYAVLNGWAEERLDESRILRRALTGSRDPS